MLLSQRPVRSLPPRTMAPIPDHPQRDAQPPDRVPFLCRLEGCQRRFEARAQNARWRCLRTAGLLFAPQKKWYLICQASDKSWMPAYGAAYSTTSNLADPASWSRLRPLGAKRAGDKAGLDFWIICDDQKAHLFFTTNDGHMWREETPLEDFPHGWSEAKLAIQGDIFEASHSYKLEDREQYLTLVEAQDGHGWRYYKAYLADRLEGPWNSLAATKEHSFASMANTRPTGQPWTDSISHGELLRSGVNQRLEVTPAHLRFLFQGVSDADRAGKPYGQIPWRLGLLESISVLPRGHVFFATDFEKKDALNGWVGPGVLGEGFAGGHALVLENPPGRDHRYATATIELPVDKMRGYVVQFSARIKAENVSHRPQPWNGVKFMAPIVTDQEKTWPAAEIGIGTFDWQKVAFRAAVPENAKQVSLVAGLEAVTGKAWFDDIRVVAWKPLADRTPLPDHAWWRR